MVYYFNPFWCAFLAVASIVIIGGAALAAWLNK